MNRRYFLMGGVSAAMFSPQGAWALSVQEFFVKELRAQGYTDFKLSYTWLGRLRIIAISSKYRREIIVNPRTGEILRDVWRPVESGDVRENLFEQDTNETNGSDSEDDASSSGSGAGSGGSGNGGSGGGSGGGGGNGGSGSGGNSDSDDHGSDDHGSGHDDKHDDDKGGDHG